MGLVTLKDVLEDAKLKRYGVGNFDCFNAEMVKGVLKAAEENKVPVIIAYGEPFIEHMDIPEYSEMVKSMVEKASIPVVLHTDHFTDKENIKSAIKNGFTSVMIDASDKKYEPNVKITKDIVDMAHKSCVSVESELGHVSGLGDIFEDDSNVFTNPELAEDFVNQTGIDALAVSIGNVHGIYKSEPKIRFEILKDISQRVKVPLVLHGASGIADEDIKRAISLGITKVNYYTDMCLAATNKIETMTNAHLYDICESIVEECYKVAVEKIKVLKN